MRTLLIRVALPVFVIAAGAAVAAFFLADRHAPTVQAAGTGPTIAVGTPSFADGRVIVPVYATGSGFDPYFGFMVHLTWNTDLLAFDNASGVGGVFDPVTGAGACYPANLGIRGGGVLFGCYTLGQMTTNTGLLATISLIPLQTGCSRLHLFTAGPPDGGGTDVGTVTWDQYGNAQSNAYIDGSTTDSGVPCTPGTPTPGTPFPTLTPTPSPTIPVGTPTPTPISPLAGADIEVGSVSVSGGAVLVPVLASGSGFNPYRGANIHLRWDASVFAFSKVTAVGGILDPTIRAYCVTPLLDSDGGGATYGCVLVGAPSLSTGLLATFTLVPTGAGCSPLHLFTVGPPDNGQSTYGTYTMSADAYPQVQQNALTDGSVCFPADGATPAATATSTATATATSTAIATATLTTTPTPTATLTTNPTATATAAATMTPIPTSTATAAATMTPTPTATATPVVDVCARADVNNDGKVNVLDLVALARRLGKPYDPAFDLNGDGRVNAADLRVVLRCLGRAGGQVARGNQRS